MITAGAAAGTGAEGPKSDAPDMPIYGKIEINK